MIGGGAVAERGGLPNTIERTNGHPDPDAVPGEAETGQEVEVETESKTG